MQSALISVCFICKVGAGGSTGPEGRRALRLAARQSWRGRCSRHSPATEPRGASGSRSSANVMYTGIGEVIKLHIETL